MSASARPPGSSEDDPEREGAAAFVLSLRERGVVSRPVLRAMEIVPRQAFAPRRFADLARSDIALPLPSGQTMTAPAAVAAMLVALDPGPGARVLEVGTGTGYVTALLAEMGGEGVSVERNGALLAGARNRLAATGCGIGFALADGDGLRLGPEFGTFDRVLLNGAVTALPPGLLQRLAPNGRLVCAVPSGTGPHLLTVLRRSAGSLDRLAGAALRISRLIENVA